MWEHLSSVLIGGNPEQTCNIYTGKGRNGKSMLVKLRRNSGEYIGTLPTTYITRARRPQGSTCSELMQLIGKRYAVCNEPTKGDKIDEGTMKEITGCDKIQGRQLFQEAQEFDPQFKLVVCTNNLPEISSNDEGTWRRIRVVPFKSYFTDTPNPNDKYEFKVDKNIKEI